MRKSKGEYPLNWFWISWAVKEAADWECIRCHHPDNPDVCKREGVRRGELPCTDRCTHEPAVKQRVLTVHHLDMDKSNCAWWNLAALCQLCHLRIQTTVIMERVWMLAHSQWFFPYVAGYYAAQKARAAGQNVPTDYYESLTSLPVVWVNEHAGELIAYGQGLLQVPA